MGLSQRQHAENHGFILSVHSARGVRTLGRTDNIGLIPLGNASLGASVRPTARLASAVLLLLAATAAQTQAVYKSVDETGRIVYTDRPPAANAAPAVKPPARPSTYEYE